MAEDACLGTRGLFDPSSVYRLDDKEIDGMMQAIKYLKEQGFTHTEAVGYIQELTRIYERWPK